jgi:phosphoenolpyruvate carboxykinase (GTP)
VPISAFIFGGRRAKLAPLVYQANDWSHGVFIAATMASETTAAAAGKVGVVRRDPMAMRPFCGYNMGDYFRHWLEMGNARPGFPKIFHVNWFRTNEQGKFLWPGFGENLRVLQWIHGRIHGTVAGRDSEIGVLPAEGAIDVAGLDVSEQAMTELLAVDRAAWTEEVRDQEGFLKELGHHLPEALWQQHRALEARLRA